ncbi:MAG: LamB/YcsF family protein, partial [Verrucomicrobiae bacterium]|nr:LamB/YcsF family protein [Verrucomicrobiae bacterium]
HATENDAALAARYVGTIRRWFPRLRIFARAGGRVADVARAAGLSVWEEAFLDRGYRPDGTLIPRGDPGALLGDPAAIRVRIRDVRSGRGLLTESGERFPMAPRTWCVHSDTPDSLRLARIGAEELAREGGRMREEG